MRPQAGRVWRKTQYQAWRGHPRGRRATHQIQTTFGRKQRLAAWHAQFKPFTEEQDASPAT